VVTSGNDEDGGDGDDDDDDEVTEEETEGEAPQPQGGRHQERVESSHPIITFCSCYLPAHSPQLSCLGLFQHICSRSHCCYLQTVSQAHQTWQKHQPFGYHMPNKAFNIQPLSPLTRAPKSHTKGAQICPSFSLPTSVCPCDTEDDGIEQDVQGPSSSSTRSTPPAVDYSRQISLPHLLQRKKQIQSLPPTFLLSSRLSL
ncbi:hypothetical protein AB205_0153830, partial [Aquarana catesbeiana]